MDKLRVPMLVLTALCETLFFGLYTLAIIGFSCGAEGPTPCDDSLFERSENVEFAVIMGGLLVVTWGVVLWGGRRIETRFWKAVAMIVVLTFIEICGITLVGPALVN